MEGSIPFQAFLVLFNDSKINVLERTFSGLLGGTYEKVYVAKK